MSSRVYDFALAAASGVLLALSFPKFGHPAFGLDRARAAAGRAACRAASSRDRSLRRALLLGLVTGIIYFTGTLYWITRVMAVYGGLQHVGRRAGQRRAHRLPRAVPGGLRASSCARLVLAYGPRALMAAPLVWVATELGRTHIFTGFPWVLLGYSQATVLPIAQLASVFGVYGVSVLVAAVARRWRCRGRARSAAQRVRRPT